VRYIAIYAAVVKGLMLILGSEKRLAFLYGLPVAVVLIVLIGEIPAVNQCMSALVGVLIRCGMAGLALRWLSGYDVGNSNLDGCWPPAIVAGSIAMQVVCILICRWATACGFASMRRRES
jgi:hypothetical protein